MNIRFAMAVAALLVATSAQAIIPFTVSLESEAPGIQESTAGFTSRGVERFEGDFDSANPTPRFNFTSTYGGSVFTGVYTGVTVRNANQFGGAGGTGRFADTPRSNTAADRTYSIDLSSSEPGGVTYFGYWLSALDGGNEVSFFQGSTLLFNFSAATARSFINGLPNASSYRGNPTAAFRNQNNGEPYAFLNFYARGTTTFDRVVFRQTNDAGYESDNHTVGRWNRISGTVVPVPGGVNAIPEPAAWLMLIAGFGLVGSAMRRQRIVAA